MRATLERRTRGAFQAWQVRVILNKADEVEPQKLMRVYGALMWSLGSIVSSPEVPIPSYPIIS